MKKLLTIIVPTYNMEKYLNKCLGSLIIRDNELFDALEVFVVNDGSEDGSSEIAHSFESQYPTVFRVVDKNNGNYGSCINTALPLAKGKYVKVLDADDYFNTTQFEAYLMQLVNLDVDLVLNDKIMVNPDYVTIETQVVLLTQGVPLNFADVAHCWAAVDMHKMAYRTSMLKEIGYYQTEGISYSDVEWMVKPLAAVESVYYTGNNVYCYLTGRQGQTIDNNVRKNSLRSLHVMLRSLGDHWKTFVGDSERKDFLFDYFVFNVTNIYREHFFASGFDDEEFRSFDADMSFHYPEVLEIVDNHQWVTFIPQLQLTKDWRERRRIKYAFEMAVIFGYRFIVGFKSLICL